ncbi:MAG: hypothetical protein LBN95_13180 [Prevotellaceae bacterium]|nr:hypothetical protein [Prevotellaceae bacterium]
MSIRELNNSKVPIIVFDKKLEQLSNVVLCPEKVAHANDILLKTGLPFYTNYNKRKIVA